MTLPPTKLPSIPADGVQHEEKVCSCPVPSLHRFEPLPGSKWLPANTLTAGQERGLEDLKMQIRRENEDYLVEHPEIEAMVQVFLQQLLEQKPRGDFLAKAVAFFTRSAEELETDAQRFLAATKDQAEPSIISCCISDVYANPFPSCESMSSAGTSNSGSSDLSTSDITTSNCYASDSASSVSLCSRFHLCSCGDIPKKRISGFNSNPRQ